MNRRDLFRWVLAVAAATPIPRVRLWAQDQIFEGSLAVTLAAVADAVLPAALGHDGIAQVVEGFQLWLREYRPDVDMEHGYGVTRLRRTGPSPLGNYAAQLTALDKAAMADAAAFDELNIARRRALIAAALTEAKIADFPERPTGDHIATDLMSFFFNSSEANDLCYGAAIGRDTCRGLGGSDVAPQSIGMR